MCMETSIITIHRDQTTDGITSPGGALGRQLSEKTRPDGDQPEGTDTVGPGVALLGWAWLTATLFGMSSYCITAALFTNRPSTGDRIGGVLVALGSAFGGVMALAFAFAALTEVCAAGTANAAGSARKRWVQGQPATARLNLRYAVAVVRVARFSAVLAGLVAGFFGFLAMGKKAADRAHDACELANSEIAKTRCVLGENRR